MSHWSKDAIIERVESEVTEMRIWELQRYIIDNKLDTDLVSKFILSEVDEDDLRDEVLEHLFETRMNESPY
tara:strand:+ start:172 stop:384 length:213 start_codon:yes stop_codon:yes gene_type:complete